MIIRNGEWIHVQAGSASWDLSINATLETLQYAYFRQFWHTMKKYTDDTEAILEAFRQYLIEEYGSLEKASPRARARINYMEVFSK